MKYALTWMLVFTAWCSVSQVNAGEVPMAVCQFARACDEGQECIVHDRSLGIYRSADGSRHFLKFEDVDEPKEASLSIDDSGWSLVRQMGSSLNVLVISRSGRATFFIILNSKEKYISFQEFGSCAVELLK